MDLPRIAEERLRLGRMVNPVRGFIDIFGAAAALVGAVALVLVARGDVSKQIALLVFGLGLVALWTISALYHSVPWREKWKKRMQRLDHSMIYVAIAATYTPLAAVVLEGALRWITLTVVWSIALFGVAQKVFLPRWRSAFSISLQTTLGWLAVFLLVPLVHALGFWALAVVAAGGVFYTLGMVFLVTGRPRLWPRVFGHHEVMHLMVMAGAACHYVFALRWVAAY